MLLARQYWVFELPIHFTPQYLAIALISMILLLLKRRFLLTLIIAGCVAYFGWPYMQILYPPAATRVTGGTVYTILEANVNKYNDVYEGLIAQVQELQPTIIVLNEVDATWINVFKREFGEIYPSSIELPTDDHRGMAIFSQETLGSYQVVNPSPESSPLIRVELKDRPLTLYAVHPLSPVTEDWAGQRDAYIRMIGTMAREEAGDLIVVGDFNSTIFSPLFRDMLAQGALLYGADGFGWKPTWRRGTPLAVPIDQVVYRGRMSMRGFDVLGDIGSDHRPILATIEFQE